MSRVVVHIDRLVVGVPTDPRAIEAAVREAVAHELRQPGAVDRVVAGGDRATVEAGYVHAGDGPAAIATAIGLGIGGGSG